MALREVTVTIRPSPSLYIIVVICCKAAMAAATVAFSNHLRAGVLHRQILEELHAYTSTHTASGSNT
jgi:hypothetical protein